ncbi:MAG: hypothetical protein AAB545_03315 [Patescibacteria group bacterium]
MKIGLPKSGEGEKDSWWKVLLKFIGVIALGGFVILLFLLALGYAVQKYTKEQGIKAIQEFYAEEARLGEEIKKDTIGGKTPEETFDMFLQALKTNDPNEVVKYYAVTERKAELEKYKKELEKYGDLKVSFDFFSEIRNKGTKICSEKPVGCTFKYTYINKEDSYSNIVGTKDRIFIPKGSESTEMADISLNPFTKVWKIVKP